MFVLFCLVPLFSQAQEDKSRTFDQEKIKRLKSDERFDYYEKAESDVSYFEGFGLWWDRIMEAISSFFTNYLNIGISPYVFRILFYLFMGGILFFLIMKLMGADFRRLIHFRTKNKYKTSYHINDDEPIENIDFQKKIAEARENENHTLIVRYYYLFSLQLLSEQGLLDYQARKTNTQYLQELKTQPLQTCFSTLAHTFEYIWYGEFQAMNRHSHEMEMNFNQLKSALS